MTKSSFSVLNSGLKESTTQKFTKPLRGFLGGKKVTAAGSKNLLSGMERIGVGIILLTIGLPYTLVAGGILTGSIIKNEAFKKKVKSVKTQESSIPSLKKVKKASGKPLKTQKPGVPPLKTAKEATVKPSKNKQNNDRETTPPPQKDPTEKNETEQSESTGSIQDILPPAGHAYYEMAMQYKSSGTQNDKALQLFQQAAYEDHSEAQFELARFLQLGIGVWRDEKKAFQLYEEAAANGSDNAKLALGDCYKNGIGVVEDKDQAALYYNEVANRNSEGYYRHGLLYYDPLSRYDVGALTHEHLIKAIARFDLAADQCHLEALTALITIYEKGIPGIINFDLNKATEYRKKLIVAQTS